MEPLNEICGRCGLTRGGHRADSIIRDQCPVHDGYMDWPDKLVTIFKPTGEYGEREYGKLSKIFSEDAC